jgi:4-diphosphocytidyl-2-C-methyl-D-erythritol kinase
LISFPNCKINIGLCITGKRPDGFHNLESVFYPVPFTDALEIIPSSKRNFSFLSEGIKVTENAEDNLCVKAFQLLKKDYDLPSVEMFLLKKLPSGAGLGGGSSNASFTLKMLNELFELKISEEKLENFAAQLGSDCPFFIKNKAAFVSGRGEFLEEINLSLKGFHISIIHPGIHISTKEAFANIKPGHPEISLKEQIQKPVSFWQNFISNDFENYAFSTYPELAEIKEKLYNSGALYAAMSGSGSAVYGISEKELNLKDKMPGNYLFWQGELE